MNLQKLLRGALAAAAVFLTIGAGSAFAGGKAETSSQPATAQSGGTISVWVQGDAVRYPGFVAVTKAFEQKYPDIKVELTNVPGSWTDEYQKLLTGYVGGVWPDVVYAKSFALPTFASKGMLLDLTSDWNQAKTGVLNAGPKLNEIVANLCSYNGKVYGLPRGQYWFALGYNTDMLKNAGIAQPPKTWEEWQSDAAKLTDKSAGTWGFAPYTYYKTDPNYTEEVEMWTGQLGGEMMSYDSSGKPVYHLAGNAKMKQALQYAYDNIYNRKDWLDPALDNADDSAELNLVFNNKIAMWWMHGGTISRFEKAAPNLHYLTAPLPAVDNSRSYIDAQDWMISAKTKLPAAAWKYIEYFTSQPGEAMFAPYEGHLSVWPQNWSLPVYTSQPAYQGLIEQYKLKATIPYRYHDGWLPVRAAIAVELQKAMFQKESIDQALTAAQKAAESELAKVGL